MQPGINCFINHSDIVPAETHHPIFNLTRGGEIVADLPFFGNEVVTPVPLSKEELEIISNVYDLSFD
jgi:hypothetical protein